MTADGALRAAAALAPPADGRVLSLLAAEGFGDLFHERQHVCCSLVERYALDLAVRVAEALDLPERLAVPHTAEALHAAAGFAPAFLPALRWLLAILAAQDLLEERPDGFRRARALPTPSPEVARAAALSADPAYEPAFALLDEAAALYPRVARGEAAAERALFLRARLWQAYFSNANPYYALGNQVAARAAATVLAEAGGGTVLEVGAGLGSATEALLATLAARDAAHLVARYVMTEPVAFFRRRAEQALAERWRPQPLVSGVLDVNAPWAAQGTFEPATLALVWGVNVFHLAHELDGVLAEARAALRPGGWLVAGEGLRPRAGRPVAAELPFQLLEGFTAVRLHPERRRSPGFLTASEWRGALCRAGFEAVRLVPDAERVQGLSPLFLGAAVCGRRPPA